MKNDVGGHDNHHYNNIYGYISYCFGIDGVLLNHIDWYFNNTCIINQETITNYGNFPCGSNINTYPKLGNNTIYLLSNNIDKVGLCGLSEKKFQETFNNDLGTIIQGTPNNTQIINQAKQLLFI